MASQAENVLKIYRTLSKIPALSGGRILGGGKTVISKWSQRNVERKKTTKIAYNYTLDDDFKVVCDSGFGGDVSNELLSSFSPSETFKALIREQTEGNGNENNTKKQYLEIWKSRFLIQCIDLTALEIHGDVYADSEFSALEWSPDEKSIAYIAEKKIAKSEPFYKRKPIKPKKDNDTEDTPPATGLEYEYKQDWGEQLVGKYFSVIVVCNLETETFTVLEGLPSSWCPGQVIWAPDGSSLVGVAWETDPRRLGLIFCPNRQSVLFNITLDGSHTVISKEKLAPRSPRFSPDGARLVWLQKPINGPHNGTMQLASTKWPVKDTPKIQSLIDIVDDSIEIEGKDKFYGVYALSLPRSGFSSDSKRLVFSSAQQNEIRSYVLNLETLKLTNISLRKTLGSTTVLDVRSDIVLASRSSINRPSQLILAHLPKERDEASIEWKSIGDVSSAPEEALNINVEYLDLKHDNNDEVGSFTAIYVAPPNKENKALPLIVWPHGGPHSAFANSFSLETALFGMLGFAVVKVNYRGSTGQGETSVKSLPGHIGQNDVGDCLLAATTVIERFKLDSSNAVLYGGSHGGFIILMMSGMYPNMFRAVAARNPVTNFVAKYNYADNPDSCAVEAGQEYTEVGEISEELLLAMRRASPIIHGHKVRAPTVLMLGSNDKRVPYYQGLEYYHRLKANGCKAKVFVYPDNHSLSSVAVEMDNLINSALWLMEHTQKDN